VALDILVQDGQVRELQNHVVIVGLGHGVAAKTGQTEQESTTQHRGRAAIGVFPNWVFP